MTSEYNQQSFEVNLLLTGNIMEGFSMEQVRVAPIQASWSFFVTLVVLTGLPTAVLAQGPQYNEASLKRPKAESLSIAQFDDFVDEPDDFDGTAETEDLDQLRLQVEAEKLRLKEEQLRIENENFRLEQEQLQLRRDVLERENDQLGLTENSAALSLDQSTSQFSDGLQTIPIESKILVFQSSNAIAEAIAEELVELSKSPDSYGINSIVVYEPEEFANVNSYRLFENLRSGLVSAYIAEGIGVQLQLPDFAVEGVRGGLDSAGVLQTSTTVLRSAAELFSYFRSEEILYPNAFKPDGNSFLIAQLVAALRRAESPIQVYAPAIYLNSFSTYENPIEAFLGDLEELAGLRSQAEQAIALASDASKIERLQTLNIQAGQLLNLLRFADSGSGSQAEGQDTAQIFRLIQGAQISQILNSEDKRVLILDLLESGGSSRTRRSLFSTMFTGKKTSYSGGAAVQYFLVNPDNSLATANVLYRNSGFKAMQRSRGN